MSNEEIALIMIKAFKQGKKVLIIGNGGSASEASHFAGELICRFKRNRQSLPAIALNDPTIITAIGNDYGFERVFSRQIEGLGKKGDILITLSTSGSSKNITEAIRQAKIQGMRVISFPTNSILGEDTPITQLNHLHMIHEISRLIENEYV